MLCLNTDEHDEVWNYVITEIYTIAVLFASARPNTLRLSSISVHLEPGAPHQLTFQHPSIPQKSYSAVVLQSLGLACSGVPPKSWVFHRAVVQSSPLPHFVVDDPV